MADEDKKGAGSPEEKSATSDQEATKGAAAPVEIDEAGQDASGESQEQEVATENVPNAEPIEVTGGGDEPIEMTEASATNGNETINEDDPEKNNAEPMEVTSQDKDGKDEGSKEDEIASSHKDENSASEEPIDNTEAKEDLEVTDVAPQENGTDAKTISNEVENKMDDSEGQAVTGVIFQFSEDTVLYEFNIDGDDVIGEMPTLSIVLADGTELKKKEQVANFIQLGDEIKVSVVMRDNLKEFTYDEEEEEVGEDGEVTQSTRTVHIQPQWTAVGKGNIVAHSTSNGASNNLKDEDVLVLEDQLENMFDYEPENDEDEDVLLIEDVNIDDEVETKSVAAKIKTPKPVPKAVQPVRPAQVEKKIDETFRYKAKLVQIRKPSSAQDPQTRVTSCLLELIDGKHAGKALTSTSVSMFMWGYNLAKANLNSVVKFGDVCQVDCMIQSKKEGGESSNEEVLVVKKCYFGPCVEKPIRPTNDQKFAVHLSSRGVDETGFLKWVYGQSPSKPYFPFVSDMFQGTVQEFARDSATNLVIGIIVSGARLLMKANKEGGLVSLVNDNSTQQPAPPGMEEDHVDNFATKSNLPPEDPNEWTALHHLQDCCKTDQSFEIIGDSTKVVIPGKKVEFLFDEATNFHATTEDRTTVVFYSVGTLAFFLKSRGLKYGAYVARTEALGHKQFVKAEDSQSVLDFMLKSTIPANVKLGDPMQVTENSTPDESAFKDRCSLTNENWVIGCDGQPPSFDKVYICNADFYIGGVSIGKCDPRLLVKIGDPVKCQVHEMTNAEKRKLKKLTGQSIEHVATLAYVGSEKRPKSATLTSFMAAKDLNAYLAPMGWTVEEFDALKTFGVRPPKEVASAEDLKELVEQNQHAQVPMAINLVKEVMKISTPSSSMVDTLLKTDDDVKVAVFISKVLTTALVNRIQHNLKAKIQDHFATPQFSSEMQSQISKIAAAETTFEKKEVKKFVPKPVKPPSKESQSSTKESLPEKLKKVEEKTKRESDEKIAASKSLSRSKAPIRDARKILDSYKESKKMDDNVDLPKLVDEWTPLEYLRHFSAKKKKISTDDRYIHFGRVKFLKTTRTNFQAEYGETDSRGDYPFYTLEQLYLAYLHKSLRHSKYLEKLRFLNKKQQSMNHRDRDAFIKFLDGTRTSNVKRLTRRDLNPEQYMDMIPAPSSSSIPGPPVPADTFNKYSLEALQREEEQNLKARMQLHLLESQSRQPPPRPLPAPLAKPSRFDQMYHPNQVQQPAPRVLPQPFTTTVVVPQVQSHDPYAGRLRQSPPQPQMYESRMRSRSPMRRLPDYDPSLPTAASPPRMSPPRRWSPPPRRPSPHSDIAQRWNQQMASIGAPPPPPNVGAERRRYGEQDALERLAAQEAQREEERLRRDASRYKEVIDLADSDDDDPGPPPQKAIRIPSPPRLSNTGMSWQSADPLREAYERQRSLQLAHEQQAAFHASSAGYQQRQQSPPRYNYDSYGRY